MFVCVCVCMWERERETERASKLVREVMIEQAREWVSKRYTASKTIWLTESVKHILQSSHKLGWMELVCFKITIVQNFRTASGAYVAPDRMGTKFSYQG
jgi:hypothetical protein